MRKAVIFFMALAVLMAISTSPAHAQVQLPHAFYGNVLINGAAAPDGTQVSATVDTGETISTQNPVTTVGGSYGVNSPKLLVQGDIPDGATITFHVTNADGTAVGGTATFSAGGGPDEKNLSVTIKVPSTPPAGDGGDGGVGGAPAPEITTVSITGLTATVSLRVDDQGIVQSNTTLTTTDSKLSLYIAAGNKILDAQGSPLTSFSAVIEPSPPAPPPRGAVLLAYNLGPDVAIFDPPITLSMSYDPEALPEDLTEDNLSVAYWDSTEWLVLEAIADTTAKTVSCEVSHFTIFAVVATPPPLEPAAFAVSNLSIQPTDIQPKEVVTITAMVTNTGGTEGSHTVVLNINGVKEDEKSVTLGAGQSQEVSFSVSRDKSGSYAVTVDGLSGSFNVAEPVVPPTPEPAVFSVKDLIIKPTEVQPKEAVTITASVTNTGGTEGSYTVILKINGVKEAEKSVTIAAGGSQDVAFSVTKEEPGSHTVTVDGLSSNFTVAAAPKEVTPVKPAAVNWPLVGGIIGAVIVVALVILYFVRKRTTD